MIERRLSDLNFSQSLTVIFDDLNERPYLDYHHVNHVGNKIISQYIWKIIKTRLKAD